MPSQDLDRVRRIHQEYSLHIVALLRLFVALALTVAIEVAVETRWREQFALVALYGAAAIAIAVWSFTAAGKSPAALRVQSWFAIVDIAAIFTFKTLSPPGAYVPLLVMTLLPMLVIIDVSWRRASALLAFSAVAFAVEIFRDPILIPNVGWGRPALALMIYCFLCFIALLAVRAQARYVNQIAALTVSREALLVQSMAAADDQQRAISEFLHDRPLQSVLAARMDVQRYTKRQPDDQLARALDSLGDASRDLRQATFELHPAVLEHAGLAAAIAQLASNVTDRSGIPVETELEYPASNTVDSLLFGVARELLSNVVRHSHATAAEVTLKTVEGMVHLVVSDNGVGLDPQIAALRVAQGHIGLASHRARIEASGGSMTIEGASPGTRVRVAVQLR